jgi:hypothetical protein
MRVGFTPVILSLSQLLEMRLKELGDRTTYWLSERVPYARGPLSEIMRGKRAIPARSFPRWLKALDIEPGSADAKALEEANRTVKGELKKDSGGEVKLMRLRIGRLEKEVDRLRWMVEKRDSELAKVRDEQTSTSQNLRATEKLLTAATRELERLRTAHAAR